MPTREAPEAVVAKIERLLDGAWAVTLRIDDGSDWESLPERERALRETVHTFYADHGGAPDPERWLRGRQAYVAARHLAMQRVHEKISALGKGDAPPE